MGAIVPVSIVAAGLGVASLTLRDGPSASLGTSRTGCQRKARSAGAGQKRRAEATRYPFARSLTLPARTIRSRFPRCAPLDCAPRQSSGQARGRRDDTSRNGRGLAERRQAHGRNGVPWACADDFGEVGLSNKRASQQPASFAKLRFSFLTPFGIAFVFRNQPVRAARSREEEGSLVRVPPE